MIKGTNSTTSRKNPWNIEFTVNNINIIKDQINIR